MQAGARACFAATSPARTLEALAELLGRLQDGGSAMAGPGVHEVSARLSAERAEAEDRAEAGLADVEALAAALERLLAGSRAARGFEPPFRVVERRVRWAWRRLRRAGNRVRGASDGRRLHDLRVTVKKLRYILEAFSPLAPVEARAAVAPLKVLQEELGTVHDCDELHERVLACVTGAEDRLADALCDLDLDLARARVKAYEGFRAAWRKPARTELRKALAMFCAAVAA